MADQANYVVDFIDLDNNSVIQSLEGQKIEDLKVEDEIQELLAVGYELVEDDFDKEDIEDHHFTVKFRHRHISVTPSVPVE